jgi:hypothetical protein
MGARAVLQSLRDLALSQRAHVVAEGVETREQLRVIRELEIRAGQGFLLGRPNASVAATYVDVDRLGGEIVPASTALALPAAASVRAAADAAAAGASDQAVRPSDEWPSRDLESRKDGQRAIILPTPRVATHLELERSAA